MFWKNGIRLILLFFVMFQSEITKSQISIGVFADCQYCDCNTAGSRYYRNSLSKLNDCIGQFNKNREIRFVAGLGDLIDRDLASFDSVNTILAKSEKPVCQVAGNHDFEVAKEDREKVSGRLKLDEMWYSFTEGDWKFIFLNGNEITLNSANPKVIKSAGAMLNILAEENRPNNQPWNGGMSSGQLKWLKKELKKAENRQSKVVLFCHYPLLPLEAHTLWNSQEVLDILEKHPCVKIWINGHNHAGNYDFWKGIHFVNLKGMVETAEQNAFAEIVLSDGNIEIKGFGREESRTLRVR